MMGGDQKPKFDRFDANSVNEWSRKLGDRFNELPSGKKRNFSELELCYACTGLGPPPFHSANSGDGSPAPLEATAGSCLEPHRPEPSIDRKSHASRTWIFGKVLDPRSAAIQRANRWFLFACVVGVAVDPLFLSLLSINSQLSCLYIQVVYAIVVTTLRCLVDAMYLWQIWLQLKLAYVSKKSLVLGRGDLVWDARKIAHHYLWPLQGFAFDVFVILPIPQTMLWIVVPSLVAQGGVTIRIMNYILLAFLFQYIPKLLHLVLVGRRLQRVTGYIFGTAYSGFVLNLAAYFSAAHVVGSIWYLLTVQRVESCIHSECANMENCNPTYLRCPQTVAFSTQPLTDPNRLAWAQDPAIANNCLSAGPMPGGNFSFGIYSLAVPLVTNNIPVNKILLPLFWGVMTMSSFGNALTPTDHTLEVVFSLFVVTLGLLLFSMLIGNIQGFLCSITAMKEETQLCIRDQEWWMQRRQLPATLRQRVREHEQQKWAATRGVDEEASVRDLPVDLRCDIKRHLCLDLVRQVPLFDQMDDLVLNNICERLKPLLFIKGEKVLNAGDPVWQMLFIVRGRMESEYHMHPINRTSTCILGLGNFCGDELISWCLSKPRNDCLPLSMVTLTTLNLTEAFGLEAQDLRYITKHFPFKFANDQLKHTARYYSSSWRMWAAATVQLAWWRHKACCSPNPSGVLNFAECSVSPKNSNLTRSQRDRLRFYTAIFTSPKPQDNLE